MLGFMWRATRGYRLRPWRSPYLRWRMETYWGIQAEQIRFVDFWRFAWRHRQELLRFLRWAERMSGAPTPSRSRLGSTVSDQ
jgi:hypothetical protein